MGTAEGTALVKLAGWLNHRSYPCRLVYKRMQFVAKATRFLIVVPCPRMCWSIVVDCWSTLLLLLTSGDVEENPGPKTAELLQQILDNQKESDDKMNTIRKEVAELNMKTERMNRHLMAMQEMQMKIERLENIVQQQAERLVDYENRSRRNNLLIFGVPEARTETETDLRKVVVDNIVRSLLGVETKSIERIHRIGKQSEGRVRPVIMKFMDYREKEKVMRNCKKLKGTSFSINNDYSKETVDLRKKLWESSAPDRAKGARVSLVYDKLKINGRMFVWDQEKNERRLYKSRSDKIDKDVTTPTASAHDRHESFDSDSSASSSRKPPHS
nr:uncharacterized protein LOC129387103 [Dermacentor andersoni]